MDLQKIGLLEQVLSKGKQEINTTRTLYLVMKEVGGYEQLMNLPLPALNEIVKCMEHFNNEQSKAMKRSRK